MIDLGISLNAGVGWPIVEEVDRFRHLIVFGGTGTGKTNFLLNLIRQEINNPIIVLDPNGALANQTARLDFKQSRLIYVNAERPLSLNPLLVNRNKSGIANELLELINAITFSLNPEQMSMTAQMNRILTNAIKDLPDLTLKNLTDLMDYENHRKKIQTEYWQRFDEKNKQGYYVNQEQVQSAKRISARLSILSEDENIKPFAGARNDFNIKEIIKDKKIVVFDLSGFDTEAIVYIGCLVSFQIKNYYLTSKGQTEPLYFYCDEFHRFFTKDFDRLLTEGRRFKISVNMATHGLSMINPKLEQIIRTNTMVKAVLSINSDEAKRLAPDMKLTEKDLTNIDEYNAYVLIGNKVYYVISYPPPELKEFPELEAPQFETPPLNFLRDDWFPCS